MCLQTKNGSKVLLVYSPLILLAKKFKGYEMYERKMLEILRILGRKCSLENLVIKDSAYHLSVELEEFQCLTIFLEFDKKLIVSDLQRHSLGTLFSLEEDDFFGYNYNYESMLMAVIDMDGDKRLY